MDKEVRIVNKGGPASAPPKIAEVTQILTTARKVVTPTLRGEIGLQRKKALHTQ